MKERFIKLRKDVAEPDKAHQNPEPASENNAPIDNPPVQLPITVTARWSKQLSSIISAGTLAVVTTLLAKTVLATSWIAALSVGGVAFASVELAKWLRNRVKSTQYQAYKSEGESDHAFDNLTDTQHASFHAGRKAAKSYTSQVFGLTAWQTYSAPKDYYAGFEAQVLQDQELINKVKSFRKV